MKKYTIFILILLIFLNLSFAQKYYTPAQKKLLARRAAIVDGYRQLAESIKGVKITSSTYVKDFVTQSDTISAEMKSFIMRGAQVVDTRYLPDGTCEVDMVLYLDDLINFLALEQAKYNFSKWRNVNFNSIKFYNPTRVIRVTGTGAPPGGMSESEIRKLKDENRNMKAEIIKLKAKISSLKRKLREASSYQQNFLNLLRENSNLKKEINNLKNRLRNFTSMFGNLQQYKSKYERLVQNHRKLQKKLRQFQALLSTFQGYQRKYQKVLKEKQDLQNKYDNLVFELESLKSQLNEYYTLKTQVSSLLNKIEDLKREKEELEEQLANVSTIREEYNNLKEENARLKGDNVRLLSQIQTLQNVILELKNANRELKRKLAKTKRRPGGVWRKLSPRQKLMARRAAIMDGYRQLMEYLQGIRIDSKTTVKDFVTQSDIIKGAMQGFIRGAQVIDTRYLPDGTCEVDMVVYRDDFINFLKRTARDYSLPVNPSKFNNIRKYYRRKVVKVTGTGAANY